MNSMKSISAIHPAITENMKNMLMKHVAHISIHKSHNASISAMSNLFQNMASKVSAFQKSSLTLSVKLQLLLQNFALFKI